MSPCPWYGICCCGACGHFFCDAGQPTPSSLLQTFFGAYSGFRKPVIEQVRRSDALLKRFHNLPLPPSPLHTRPQPVRTNQIPRQIPVQSVYTRTIPAMLMGGILPFGCIFIQLFFILNSIWSGEGDAMVRITFAAFVTDVHFFLLQGPKVVLRLWLPIRCFHHPHYYHH